MTVYRRGASGSKDLTLAAAVGLLAGSVAFYFARIWFQREPLGGVGRSLSPEREDLPGRGGRSTPDRRSDSPPG